MKIFVCDNILIKDRICAAYSFKPPYTATAVEKIIAAGMELTDSQNEADAVLSTAELDGMYYIRPTYGTVSRFGLVAEVSSMDQIGVCAHETDTAFFVLSAIAGYDKNDGTVYAKEKYDFFPPENEVKTVNLNDLDFKYANCINAVLHIISTAEFSGNAARFDGLKFGYSAKNFTGTNELTVNSRSEAFTPESKLKALMGTYVLSEGQFEKYYLKAAKLRRLINQGLDEILKQYDAVRVPDAALAYLSGCPAFTKPDGSCFIAQKGKEGIFYGI